MLSRLAVGSGTGIVSAVVMIASITSASAFMGALLPVLVPLPIVIAGLGWGWLASSTAAVVAAGLVSVTIAPKAGILHLCAVGLPMASFAYLLLLNRQHTPPATPNQPAIEWYPVGRVLAYATLLAGALTTAMLYALAGDATALEAEIRKTIDLWADGNLPFPKIEFRGDQEAERAILARTMVVLFPISVALSWMMFATLNLWLGARIVHASGLLARPWPDLTLTAMPKEMTAVFVALVIGFMVLTDYYRLICIAFLSATAFAYVLVGLAIVHNVTRGWASRSLILSLLYLCLIIPYLSIIVWFMALPLIGLIEPLSPIQRRPGLSSRHIKKD
ncbi:MAG: DUF2232 domain-containing protein [Hyphomicrobiaceae bacterium]